MSGAAAKQWRSPERILVRGPNWLGDLVMSTPGLAALRHRFPKARIVALVPEALVGLLEGSEDVDEVWGLATRGGRLARIRSDARRIAAGRFDLGLLVPESISSALSMRWGGVGRVVGFARDPIRRALLHEEVPAPETWGRRRWVSRERFVLELMNAVGAESSDTTLHLAVRDVDEERLADALRQRDPDSRGGFPRAPVVLAPGASFGESKCWPVDSFAELADGLVRRGETIVLVGTEAERARIAAVREAMQAPAIDLGGALDLGALKALLREGRLLVANDAGARHVAAAFATPSVIFFGPTSVAKTADNLERIEVLETEHDCRPCYARTCPIDHRCLTSIGVPQALAAVERALAVGDIAVGAPE